MNRWKPVIAGCCREPVFWAALLLAGFGIWLYGYEAAPVAAPPATQARAAAGQAADTAATADTAADGPAPLARRESGGARAIGAHGGGGADDDSIGGEAEALPRRWIREADVLVHRGDELILDAGLPAKFLDRVPLHLEDIHQALEDAGRRLRDNDISGEEQ